MFGWKRRKARKSAERATGGAHLQETVEVAEPEVRDVPSEIAPPAPSVDDADASDVPTNDDGPGPEDEPESEPDEVRTERPMVDLLTDGERLGFEPELHVPVDGD